MALGADALSLHDPDRCEQQDADVEPKAASFNIPDVERKLLFPCDGVAAVDLSPASNSRPAFVAACLFGCVPTKVLHQKRARANQAHISLEHVEQLRQFIEAGPAQKSPERG